MSAVDDDQNRIKYTPERDLALAKIICQVKAYKRDDKKQAEKISTVEKLAAEHDLFKDYKPSGSALMRHFNKLCTAYKKKAGIAGEGANLSSITKEPSELELLLSDMIEDAENTQKERNEVKLQKEKLAQKLASIEASGLGHQGRINTPDISLDLKNDSDDDFDCDVDKDEENLDPNGVQLKRNF